MTENDRYLKIVIQFFFHSNLIVKHMIDSTQTNTNNTEILSMHVNTTLGSHTSDQTYHRVRHCDC